MIAGLLLPNSRRGWTEMVLGFLHISFYLIITFFIRMTLMKNNGSCFDVNYYLLDWR